jgi:hypothetical protein
MTYHRFVRAVSVLLIAAPAVVSAGSPRLADQAAEARRQIENRKQVEVRKQEEQRLRKKDNAYRQQAKALARQYRKSASRAALRGGDPTPLLEAADYFDAQAK